MGIKFAPLKVPLHRRLESVAVAAIYFIIILGGFVGFYILYYTAFYTQYWPLPLLYVLWTYVIDIETPEKGGRRIEWIRNWAWWKYFRNYFPIKFERVPWVQLDPKKNYIFCCFPHGILPTGVFSGFGCNGSGYEQFFPHHRIYTITLVQNFYLPIMRELILSLGSCSCSSKSIDWILGTASGGRSISLTVGGAAEAFLSRPGNHQIYLRTRKGFVKKALVHGAPLIPVYSFGETDLYKQVPNPKGSLIRQIQDWIKGLVGIAMPIFVGRGFFQYSFGLLPFRRPVNTIVGRPIDVPKTENPTQQQIDELHQRFMEAITELFEEQKYNYLENPESAKLVII